MALVNEQIVVRKKKACSGLSENESYSSPSDADDALAW